ncbi:Mannosyl-oligosaccharide 1,2-alpha-mannosidase IB [Rhizophlyctis rosea]|nr:Mannosyl-oligosaccharide 1,2-alpha-mannosidase IB [Rhizophlyctis rosea]
MHKPPPLPTHTPPRTPTKPFPPHNHYHRPTITANSLGRLLRTLILTLMCGLVIGALYYAVEPWRVLWGIESGGGWSWGGQQEVGGVGVSNATGSVVGDEQWMGHAKPVLLERFLGGDRGWRDVEKMEFVRNMMIHAWDSYTTHASPSDELRPLARTPQNWYTNPLDPQKTPHTLLLTPIDALDTLHIMNLTSRYTHAKNLILTHFPSSPPLTINVFESTIRILGGLLSAFDLTGDKALLSKAEELADKMIKAGVFDTGAGWALNWCRVDEGWSLGSSGGVYNVNLAEMGTLGLEFQYLADVTGREEFMQKALFIYEQLHAMPRKYKGLYPTDYHPDKLEATSERYGIGAAADSFYEYLLKLWLSTGESRYREWYDESVDAISDHLVQHTADGKEWYVPDAYWWEGAQKGGGLNPQSSFNHLTCFAGGLLTLGSLTNRHKNWSHHLSLATRLADTCVRAYTSTSTGLSGDSIDPTRLAHPNDPKWALRPELVETLFYMWRLTHDTKWRDIGWEIAQKVEKYCRVEGGYVGVLDVTRGGEDEERKAWMPREGRDGDVMDTWFLGETLKYLYLLFTDDDVVPLEEYVFNTEAHPLSVRGRGRRRDPNTWVRIPDGVDVKWYRDVGSVIDISEEWKQKRQKGMDRWREGEEAKRRVAEEEEMKRRVEVAEREERERVEKEAGEKVQKKVSTGMSPLEREKERIRKVEEERERELRLKEISAQEEEKRRLMRSGDSSQKPVVDQQQDGRGGGDVGGMRPPPSAMGVGKRVGGVKVGGEMKQPEHRHKEGEKRVGGGAPAWAVGAGGEGKKKEEEGKGMEGDFAPPPGKV